MEDERSKSRGQLKITHLFNAADLGILVPEPHAKRALSIFLDTAVANGDTAFIVRATQMPSGVLFLMSIKGEPNCGVIYLYARESGDFYAIVFDGEKFDSEHLTPAEYEELVTEYQLLEFAACPKLISSLNQTPGLA